MSGPFSGCSLFMARVGTTTVIMHANANANRDQRARAALIRRQLAARFMLWRHGVATAPPYEATFLGTMEGKVGWIAGARDPHDGARWKLAHIVTERMWFGSNVRSLGTVSYKHLTLPTN